MSLKSRLRQALIPKGFLESIDTLRRQQGRMHAHLVRASQSTSLRDWEFQVYSQWGEDGIIQKLVHEIPLAHETFIEFGVEDFVEANCRFLLVNDHWSGFVIEAVESRIEAIRRAPWFWKYDLRAHQAFLTCDNIDATLALSGFDPDLGLLSIDVDGNDYWLFDAITVMRPRILVMEYNANFGAERAISVPYDPAFDRFARHHSGLYYGASLAALAHLAARKGYALMGTERAGVNAFFVRRDVLPPHLAEKTAREAYTPSRFRPTRAPDGSMTYARSDEQVALLRGLPVVNVATGDAETF